MRNSSAFVDQSLRCKQLLESKTPDALNEAVEAAFNCVSIDTNAVEGYLLLTKALFRQCRYKDAVIWYKKGLKLHSENEELLTGLRQTRIAVLNELMREEEDTSENEVEQSDDQLNTDVSFVKNRRGAEFRNDYQLNQVSQSAQAYGSSDFSTELTGGTMETTKNDRQTQVAVFQAKMERVLEHLGLLKLARRASVHILLELWNLRRVTIGLGLLFLGLLAQTIMHRQKLMVISILVICLYRSQLKTRAMRFAEDWVKTSTNKLGVLTWAPYTMFVIPVVMKVFGSLRFMLFLQQDMHLMCIVFAVAVVLVANSLRTVAGQQAKLWGEGKRLKLAAYFTTIVYWVIWCGHWADIIRLLGPAFIDASGIVLGSVTSSDLQEVCRRAFKRLYINVASDIHASADFDAWFFLGLGNWIVEYWQQPTDFSIEMMIKMLTECFDSMEKGTVRAFSPELSRLRNQLTSPEHTDELQLLVAYLKQSLEVVPPAKSFGLVILFIKSCPSFVVFSLLAVFYGVISLPLLPFVFSEFRGARNLWDCYHTGKLHEKDGLELMLLDSPLLHVWENIKGCVYCLEGSVTFSKTLTTGTHILSAATRISRLAVFASRVKKDGVLANARDIPDHIANVFLITKSSSLIFDGIRYIRDSAQLKNLQTSIVSWWSGGHVEDKGHLES